MNAAPGSPPPLPPAVLSPIAEGQRNELLDVVRGVAIFGIFLVNITGFKSPAIVTAALAQPWHPGTVNEVTLWVIEALAMGKFVPLFAMLFGVGMAMQHRRRRAAGNAFGGFFLRRMIFLLLLGIAHGILLWAGDILAVYALYGIIGLLFVNCRPKTLVIWATAILTGLLLVWSGLAAVPAGDMDFPDDWMSLGEWWVESYAHGSPAEIVAARVMEWAWMWAFGFLSFLPYAFAAFLLGLALGKHGVLERLGEMKTKLAWVLAIALPAGLALNALFLIAFYADPMPGALTVAAGWTAYLVGSLLLALSYALLIFFFVRSGRRRWLRESLAAVGRMALTNYLLQSLVANALFMSWGLGLYGSVTAPAGVAIVVAVFVVQVFLSRLWLRAFRFGPFEWIWRWLSYGTMPNRTVRR